MIVYSTFSALTTEARGLPQVWVQPWLHIDYQVFAWVTEWDCVKQTKKCSVYFWKIFFLLTLAILKPIFWIAFCGFFFISLDFIRTILEAYLKDWVSFTKKCIRLFWFDMKKNVQYFYFFFFSYLYVLKPREAVLCYLRSMCLPWMTEIIWFLSILILTGAQFQKGQEWRSEKFSRECFITCLENMKQFKKLDCPWLQSKGCISKTLDSAKNTE